MSPRSAIAARGPSEGRGAEHPLAARRAARIPLGLLLTLGSCTGSRPEPLQPAPQPASTSPPVRVLEARSGTAPPSLPGVLTHLDSLLHQRLSYDSRPSAKRAAPGTVSTVLVEHKERTGSEAPFSSKTWAYDCAFEVTEVSFVQEGDFLIAGVDNAGDLVVERWWLERQPGMLSARPRNVLVDGIVTNAQRLTPGQSPAAPVGGVHVPIRERPDPFINALEVYRGPGPGGRITGLSYNNLAQEVVAIVRDEGHRMSRLVRVQGTPRIMTPVLSSVDVPELEQLNRLLTVYSDDGSWFIALYPFSDATDAGSTWPIDTGATRLMLRYQPASRSYGDPTRIEAGEEWMETVAPLRWVNGWRYSD